MAKTERKRTSVASRSARQTAAGDEDALEPAVAKPKRTTASPKPKKIPAEISRAVRAALDKKAQDVVVLDLRNTPAFTDFFILCSGLNQRQVKAIADAVEETLRAIKMRPAHIEGYDRADWVLMDFFTFIVHVFTPQTRTFYGLERLWGDAERIDVTEEQAKRA
jgi:ribosome-associated protein